MLVEVGGVGAAGVVVVGAGVVAAGTVAATVGVVVSASEDVGTEVAGEGAGAVLSVRSRRCGLR